MMTRTQRLPGKSDDMIGSNNLDRVPSSLCGECREPGGVAGRGVGMRDKNDERGKVPSPAHSQQLETEQNCLRTPETRITYQAFTQALTDLVSFP